MTSSPQGPLALPFSRLERAFTGLFIPIAAVSWVGMLFAEGGMFTLLRVLVGAGLVTAGAWKLMARDWRAEPVSGAPAGRGSHLWLGVALAATVVLYSQPGEYLIEGADASVYLAVGHSIGRTGAIVSADPVLKTLPAGTRAALFERERAWPHPLNRFPGGVRMAGSGDVVVPDFFHLLPVWMAVFLGIFGPYGAYYVNAVFGALAVLTTWLIGRRAWSAAAGGVAAVLLAVNFGQVCAARTASSEMLAQWLLLAGVFFTLVARDRRSRVAAACAGVAIGLAGFARIDTLFLLLPLTVAWLALAWRRRLLGRAWRWYAAALGVVGGHAIVHAFTTSRLYTLRLSATAWDAASDVFTTLGPVTALAILAFVGAATIIGAQRLPARARILTLGGVVVLAPAALSPGVVSTASLLLTPVGVVAVMAGFLLFLWLDADARLLTLLVPFAAEVVLWLAWREKTSWPADFRRFVPAVLPLGLLLLAGLVAQAGRAGPTVRRVRWLLPAGLAVAWLAQASPVLLAAPMRGVHAQVGEIASRLPASAIVLTDWSVPSHLPLALQSTFGREGLQLSGRLPPHGALREYLDNVLAAGQRAYLVLAYYGHDASRPLWRSDVEGLSVRPAGVVPLRFAVLVASKTGFPRTLQTIEADVELYEIGRKAVETPVSLPVVIDVGEQDFAFALRGFYWSESMPSARVRWTDGEAQILAPRLTVPEGRDVTLVLRLATFRPAGIAAPTVRVALGNVDVGAVATTGPGFSVYRITLNASVLARLRTGASVLTIRTDTFVPKVAGLGDDTRVLGVALDWIRLE
jgi:hypothetical protein